jgi:hypothetical protein
MRQPSDQTTQTSDHTKQPSDETKQQHAYVKRSLDALRRHRAKKIRQTVAGIARSDDTIMQAGVFDHAAR